MLLPQNAGEETKSVTAGGIAIRFCFGIRRKLALGRSIRVIAKLSRIGGPEGKQGHRNTVSQGLCGCEALVCILLILNLLCHFNSFTAQNVLFPEGALLTSRQRFLKLFSLFGLSIDL